MVAELRGPTVAILAADGVELASVVDYDALLLPGGPPVFCAAIVEQFAAVPATA